MTNDEPIDEIREVRHQISAEFGHDTQALLDHYREMEKRFADRMLRKPGSARQPSEIQEAEQR